MVGVISKMIFREGNPLFDGVALEDLFEDRVQVDGLGNRLPHFFVGHRPSLGRIDAHEDHPRTGDLGNGRSAFPVHQPGKMRGDIDDHVQFLGLQTGDAGRGFGDGPENDLFDLGGPTPVIRVGLEDQLIVLRPADEFVGPGSDRDCGRYRTGPFPGCIWAA